MSKASVLAAIFLLSAIVPNCYGVLNPYNTCGGTIVYAFTPFHDNGEVNLDAVPQLAEFFAKRNIKNVHILGLYGEGPILDLKDRKALALAWNREAIRLKLNLMLEIGAMPFPDQVELAKFCNNQLNVTAITAFPLLVYEAKTSEQIIEDYQRLSDAAPNISLIYDAYTETSPAISPAEAFVTLKGRVKTLAGAIVSMDRALDIKAALPSIDGYQLWIYGIRAIASAYASNMNGTITFLPNLCPKAALEIEALVYAGKIDEAFDLHQKANRLIQMIQMMVSNKRKTIDYDSRSYIRYIRATFKIFHGMDLGERLPFDKVTPAELDKIRCNLQEFEDFINCYCK